MARSRLKSLLSRQLSRLLIFICLFYFGGQLFRIQPAVAQEDVFGEMNLPIQPSPEVETIREGPLSRLDADLKTANSGVELKTKTNQQAKRSGSFTTSFDDQFWTYLLSNNYKHWAPLSNKPTEFYQSESAMFRDRDDSVHNPHTSLSKVYMNRTAAGDPKSPPVGSVLIMENYRSDRSLQSISVMYRTAGFNPQGNDWYWVNFNPDGSVTRSKEFNVNGSKGIDLAGNQVTFASSKTTSVRLAGRTSSCIACHQKSIDDFAFFNDPRRSQPTATPARVASKK
ncbi:MAG: hypothetical protein AAFN77_13960 [Planctomycetota bacterium]